MAHGKYKFSVSMEDHNFRKVNLMTQSDGSDSYRCKDCGLEGKRWSLAPYVMCTRMQECTGEKIIAPQRELPDRIKIIRFDGGGSDIKVDDEYDRVDCPEEYVGKYHNDVWIWHPTRNEAYRLLRPEWEEVDSEPQQLGLF